MSGREFTEKIIDKKIGFYSKLNTKEKNELWDLLSDYEKYSINLKQQKQVGYGKYKFSINEYGEHYNIAKYKNLKEWDKEQYLYQKKHGQTGLDDKYKIYLFGDWCRLIENKKLIYGSLLSVSGYLLEQVTYKIIKLVNELYPHTVKMKSKKNDKKQINPLTKKKEYFYTVDFITKAYGKEEKLKKLESSVREFEQDILYPKIKRYVQKNLKNRTYRVVNKSTAFDNYHLFLFGDKHALKNCTFYNFLADFDELKRDAKDLEKIEQKFFKYSKQYILENYF